MKCYLTSCFAGFIALDENCTLLDYELFPKHRIMENMAEIQKGHLTREEASILKKMVKKCDHVIIEAYGHPSRYENLKESSKFKFEFPSKAGKFLRSNLVNTLKTVGFVASEDEFLEIIHSLSLDITAQKLKEASKAEDMLLIQDINAIDEIDETTGKLVERLREWHTIHFPELDKIRSQELYAGLIAEYGDRESIIQSGRLDQNIITGTSLGADFAESDIVIVKQFAASIRSMQELKKSLTNYVDQKMSDLAPNLQDLTGSSLGAKLIAHVGGIKRLSTLPSSTVQILGAEKALFRHLKTGERPPKHGLIYQHPEVRGAKWWIRGKIARALAAKISLAVRKDVYSGDYDPQIKEGFYERVEEIRKANPFPKRTSKSQKTGKQRIKKKKKKDKYKEKFDSYY
jgi:nucleolar protein 56